MCCVLNLERPYNDPYTRGHPHKVTIASWHPNKNWTLKRDTRSSTWPKDRSRRIYWRVLLCTQWSTGCDKTTTRTKTTIWWNSIVTPVTYLKLVSCQPMQLFQWLGYYLSRLYLGGVGQVTYGHINIVTWVGGTYESAYPSARF